MTMKLSNSIFTIQQFFVVAVTPIDENLFLKRKRLSGESFIFLYLD